MLFFLFSKELHIFRDTSRAKKIIKSSNVHIAAGYIICGTSTILVYITGGDVLTEIENKNHVECLRIKCCK